MTKKQAGTAADNKIEDFTVKDATANRKDATGNTVVSGDTTNVTGTTGSSRAGKIGNWILRLIKGVLIGIGAIMPGLSGGVLMVIFGVYDRLIYFLSHLRDKFFTQLAFFIPIGIGGVIGLVLFSVFVTEAFASSYVAVFICLFIGFVIGTLPSLWRTAGSRGRGAKGWIAFLISAALLFTFMMLGQAELTQIEPSIIIWIISGAFVGLGFVVPGLATSNFLMYFGLYDRMAAGIQSFDFGIIIPLFIGLVACVLLTAKLVNWLLNRYHQIMYHIIFGLVVGSSAAMVPSLIAPAFTAAALTALGLQFWQLLLMAIAALLVGAVLSIFFSKLENRYPADTMGVLSGNK